MDNFFITNFGLSCGEGKQLHYRQSINIGVWWWHP